MKLIEKLPYGFAIYKERGSETNLFLLVNENRGHRTWHATQQKAHGQFQLVKALLDAPHKKAQQLVLEAQANA